MPKRFFVVFVVLLFCALPLRAQTVELRGHGEAHLDAILRGALSAPPLLIVRDTIITARDTIRGDVLVLKARLILEGVVLGDLTGVESNMYLRPTARVSGRVANIAGGYYPSELASVDSKEDRPVAPYQVLQDGDAYIVEGTVKRPLLKMLGAFQMPEYNRVDGLRAEVGPSLLLPAFGGFEPTLKASVGYATERKDMLLRAELGMKRGRSTVAVGWEDNVTATNDDWIRSQLKNSIAFFWAGKDYRNYYEADRTYAEFRRILERGQRLSGIWLRAQNETAHPLAAGDPFVLFSPDSIRFNPLVPSQRVASAFLGAHTEQNGPVSVWKLQGSVEVAGKVLGADAAFNAYTATALYAMKALADHTLEIETYFRGPLPGTQTLPEQRWTLVGGSGTLYTFEAGEFRGDRLAFVETEYTIPFAQQFTLPILGAPKLKLMHNIGMAWTHQQKRDFEQNVGARVQFALAYVRYMVDPASGEGKISANVTMPAKAYPWEKKTRPTRK